MPDKITNRFPLPKCIGFIGLGNMGVPMARRLAGKGYKLVVADANPRAVEQFAAHTECEQPDDLIALAKLCSIVITMLPDGNAVQQVVHGETGLARGLAKDSVLIDMSSSSPLGTRSLNAELAPLGISLVDAPVSGGVKKAEQGTVSIMAGGEAAIINRVRPILELLGRVFHTGAVGSGHAMKSLNNYLSAATLAVSAEALLAGQRFGLDPGTMIEILNASTGRSNSTEHKYPTYILPRRFDSGFAIGLMAKDLRLALEITASGDTPSALLQTLSGIYDSAEQQLGFKADNTEVVRYLESLSKDDKGD